MKKIWIFYFFSLLFSSQTNAQTLKRVTFSSGGSSTNELPCSFGEVFSGGNSQLTMGSQQNITNTAQPEPENIISVILKPNPSSGPVHLTLSGIPRNRGIVIVTDSKGQETLRQAFDQADFDLPTGYLDTGIYFVSLFDLRGKLLTNLSFIKI